MEAILPRKEGVCDGCQQKLVTREDDTERVVKARLQEYKAKTEPLLEVFDEMGLLLNF
jgi:adenylate kinase